MNRCLPLLLCLLCACSPFQPPAAIQSIGLQACGAREFAAFKGQHFTGLATAHLRGPLRVIYPAQKLTHDIDPRRLNAMIDAQGQIMAVFCG